jgi:ribosomal protein S18 acetylase RimI-like enzyme
VVRELSETVRPWAEELLDEAFGGRLQARRGELIDVLSPPGFVAERDGEPIGLLTYRWHRDGCEIASIVVRGRYRGSGTELLEALVRHVGGRDRIWLVTTNDNLDALRFYQRRGFRLAALRPGAVDESRATLKPGISAVGAYGIPIRDELELELPAGATVRP